MRVKAYAPGSQASHALLNTKVASWRTSIDAMRESFSMRWSRWGMSLVNGLDTTRTTHCRRATRYPHSIHTTFAPGDLLPSDFVFDSDLVREFRSAEAARWIPTGLHSFRPLGTLLPDRSVLMTLLIVRLATASGEGSQEHTRVNFGVDGRTSGAARGALNPSIRSWHTSPETVCDGRSAIRTALSHCDLSVIVSRVSVCDCCCLWPLSTTFISRWERTRIVILRRQSHPHT